MSLKKGTKFAPLVVGLPRSGFSLTASVLIHFFNRTNNKFTARHKCLRYFCETFGLLFSKSIEQEVERLGFKSKLLFNNNFRQLMGGPIWNFDELGQRAYFRKYIGIIGLGDFTIITSHPIEILDQYEIIHSHGPFSEWTHNNPYSDYQRFASIRNPTGIINSACHSINALASEYLQLNNTGLTDEEIRTNLAYYKLSDEKFFRALLRPLKNGLKEQIKTRKDFHQVSWENMVTQPYQEITKLSKISKLNFDETIISEIWKEIGFRNLTGSHKHNYRVGKAYIGDEFESLTNENLEIMREEGFEEICGTLNYKFPTIKAKSYNDFQKRVSKALKTGIPLDPTNDRTLFDLAFNKSNIDFKEFGFREHPWKNETRLERSNISDQGFELAIWEEAENSIAIINLLFAELLLNLAGIGNFKNLKNLIDCYDFPFLNVKEVTKNLEQKILDCQKL